jgi:hypothetical protein
MYEMIADELKQKGYLHGRSNPVMALQLIVAVASDFYRAAIVSHRLMFRP